MKDAAGTVPFISVSAKAGTGITELDRNVSLMSDVAELKGDPAGELEAVVIESKKKRWAMSQQLSSKRKYKSRRNNFCRRG